MINTFLLSSGTQNVIEYVLKKGFGFLLGFSYAKHINHLPKLRKGGQQSQGR